MPSWQVLCEAGAGRSSKVKTSIMAWVFRFTSIGSPVEVDDVIMTLDGPFGIDMQLIQRLKNSITISEYQVAVGSESSKQ